jgi:sugar lactone lactonase YvrE
MRYGEAQLRALAARVHGGRRLAVTLVGVAATLAAVPAAAVAAQGDLIVTNLRQVIRVDASGTRTMVSSNTSPGQGVEFNMGDTIGVAMGPDGDLFVADAGWFDNPNPFQLPESGFGDTGGVWRIDPATGVRTVVSSNATNDGDADFDSPVGIAFEADGNLLVSDYDRDGSAEHLFRIDPDTGYRTLLSSNASPSTDGASYASVEGLAITPGGTIYLADSNARDGGGGVFRVDPASGERTMITNNDSPGVGDVPDFENPSAVAVDGNGDLLVADRQDEGDFVGAVIRVDPMTGERSLVSATGNPAQDFHEDLVNPAGIAVVPDDGIVVTRDPFNHEFGGVERVDPGTGARALLSIFDGPQGGADLLGPWGILVDSTPAIRATFESANVPAAGPARLRMKVSGLRYALTGRDWSLTDALPPGLAIAQSPNAIVACEDFAGAATSPAGVDVTAAAGASAIDVAGHLERGDAFCTIDVDVVAPGGPDKYVTSPADVTARVGVDPPSDATSAVRFHAPPLVTINSPSNGQTVDLGAPLTASFACVAPAGAQSCLGTSANGASLDTSAAGTFTYTATVVDAVGQVATKTTRYTVKAPATTATPPPTPPPAARQPKTGAQLALECSGAKIVLLEVIQVGNRVRFSGVTSRANAGRSVPIRVLNGARVVLARVQQNGLFEITGPLPTASIRETEKARYVAELGHDRSASVKLTRRMTMDALNVTRTTVTIYGQISKPLPKLRRDIVITERTACSGPAKVVATVRPNARGNYRATIRRPPAVESAIYRLRSRVRVATAGRKETFRTYTLVRAVDLF